MCCCGTPTLNGQPGYRWQPNDAPSVRPVNPPALADGETLIYDEPGRCGGLDSHCHHYRVVKHYSSLALLVRHGGGDDRIDLLGHKGVMSALEAMDSHSRYWMLDMIYGACRQAAERAKGAESAKWRHAAASKRIKTRKVRGSQSVKVWIEDPAQSSLYNTAHSATVRVGMGNCKPHGADCDCLSCREASAEARMS